ncbi:MAG: DUF2244 domain-containing protein [Pseudomonadota bacterium]
MTDLDAAGAQALAGMRRDAPLYRVTLWPNRSLSGRGFVGVMAFTGAMLSLPLVAIGLVKAALGLAPFLAGALGALGYAIHCSNRDGRLTEELRLWPDLIAVERREPQGRVLRWQANPYWVSVTVHPEGRGRPENYLTLKGAGREIELGAFLSPEERAALAEEVETALARARAVEAGASAPG